MNSEALKLQMTGHETFPLRQVWLSKAAAFVQEAWAEGAAPVFVGEEAIERLGVGKNMCSSMRFWAEACGVLDPQTLELTELGKLLFGDERSSGVDPYCSNIATQWLVHWQLASTPTRFTPLYYLFNVVTAGTLDREGFLRGLVEYARSHGNKTSEATIKRGVDVCLRSYLPRMTGKGHPEDYIEPLLGELDLLMANSRDVFSFRRSAHASLPDALFAYALMDYWDRLPYQTSSLDFSRITYDHGSPGKVFKLDPDAVQLRLSRLSDLTHECLVWTEQAGLRQVVRLKEAITSPEHFKRRLLRKAFA